MANSLNDDDFDGNDDQIDGLKDALRDFIDLARKASALDTSLSADFDRLIKLHGIEDGFTGARLDTEALEEENE